MDHDLSVMIDGFQAQIWLSDHSEQIGLGGCRPCGRFVGALLAGRHPMFVQDLRCDAARAAQQQVDAAIEVVKRHDVGP